MEVNVLRATRAMPTAKTVCIHWEHHAGGGGLLVPNGAMETTPSSDNLGWGGMTTDDLSMLATVSSTVATASYGAVT